MGSAEVSDFWLARGIDYLHQNPDRALQMLGHKSALLLNDYEVPDNQSLYVLAPHSPALRWSFLTFGWILPFALLGLAVDWRSPRTRLLAALLLVYGLSVVAFFVLARFRLPMVPFLVVLAALGGRWLVSKAGHASSDK